MNKKKGIILASISFTFMFGCMVNAATFKQTEADANSVKVEWDAGAVTDVQISPDINVDDSDFSYEVPRGKKEYTFYSLGTERLASGTSYFVRFKQNNTWSDSMEISTAPNASELSETAKQTSVDKNGATITWGTAYGATGYIIYTPKSNLSSSVKKVASVNTNTATIKIDKTTTFRIVPVRKLSTGLLVIDKQKRGVTLSGVRPFPKKVKKNKQVKEINLSDDKVKVEWQKMDDVDGFQLQYYNYKNKGKKNIKLSGFEHIATLSSKKMSFMKFKVRAYVLIGKKKVYGDWSKEAVVSPDITRATFSIIQKDCGSHPEADLTWKKVKGAKKYEVYMSTSFDRGYKKIATTKKTKLHVSRYAGSQMRFAVQYYFKVVGVTKINKKKYHTLNISYKGFMMNRLGRG